jgi:Phage gp6-like head-tail connector protein
MAQPVTVAEAKLFLRVEHEAEDGLIQTLIEAAQAQVEADVGGSLTSASPAGLRLAILMLVLRAYERGEDVGFPPIDEWVAPHRVVRLRGPWRNCSGRWRRRRPMAGGA